MVLVSDTQQAGNGGRTAPVRWDLAERVAAVYDDGPLGRGFPDAFAGDASRSYPFHFRPGVGIR
jgi:hypothetical protein